MFARTLSRTIGAQARHGAKTAAKTHAMRMLPQAAMSQPAKATSAASGFSIEVQSNKAALENTNNYYDGLSAHYHMFQQDWNGLVNGEREAFGDFFKGKNIKKVPEGKNIKKSAGRFLWIRRTGHGAGRPGT